MCEKCLADNRSFFANLKWAGIIPPPPPPPAKRIIKEDVDVNHDFLKGFLTATLVIILLHVGLAYYFVLT